jgi:hypothetical protein
MSDRNQGQLLTVGAFAGGLLLVVASLFGDGKEPGVLVSETQSAVHLANTSSSASADEPEPSYNLAVTQTDSSPSEDEDEGGWGKDDDEPAATPTDFATVADAGNSQARNEAENRTDAGNADTGTAARPIDVGVIHK